MKPEVVFKITSPPGARRTLAAVFRAREQELVGFSLLEHSRVPATGPREYEIWVPTDMLEQYKNPPDAASA